MLRKDEICHFSLSRLVGGSEKRQNSCGKSLERVSRERDVFQAQKCNLGSEWETEVDLSLPGRMNEEGM